MVSNLPVLATSWGVADCIYLLVRGHARRAGGSEEALIAVGDRVRVRTTFGRSYPQVRRGEEGVATITAALDKVNFFVRIGGNRETLRRPSKSGTS